MEAVIAGWVAGYAMAIATTFALTFMAWRAQGAGWLDRLIAQEVNPVLLAVPISLFATLGWTMVGLGAGSLYRLSGLDEGGWPGTGFYVVVVFAGALPLPALLLLWPRWWWMWLGMAALFIALFGGLMPALAGQ